MTHEVYLLPEDREYLTQRIAEIEQLIRDLGPEFNDVFTQSSETWHDNAPFDALRDKQSALAAELDHLRTLQRLSTLISPKKKQRTIGVGSTVTLSTNKTYLIAGDWTHKAGQHDDGMIWMSCRAPLARALLGKKLGDAVEFGAVHAVVSRVD